MLSNPFFIRKSINGFYFSTKLWKENFADITNTSKHKLREKILRARWEFMFYNNLCSSHYFAFTRAIKLLRCYKIYYAEAFSGSLQFYYCLNLLKVSLEILWLRSLIFNELFFRSHKPRWEKGEEEYIKLKGDTALRKVFESNFFNHAYWSVGFECSVFFITFKSSYVCKIIMNNSHFQRFKNMKVFEINASQMFSIFIETKNLHNRLIL